MSNFVMHWVMLNYVSSFVTLHVELQYVTLHYKLCYVALQIVLHHVVLQTLLCYIAFKFYYVALWTLLHYTALHYELCCATNSIMLHCDFVGLRYIATLLHYTTNIIPLRCELHCVVLQIPIHYALRWVLLHYAVSSAMCQALLILALITCTQKTTINRSKIIHRNKNEQEETTHTPKQEVQNPQNLTKLQHLGKHMNKQKNTKKVGSRHDIPLLKKFHHTFVLSIFAPRTYTHRNIFLLPLLFEVHVFLLPSLFGVHMFLLPSLFGVH